MGQAVGGGVRVGYGGTWKLLLSYLYLHNRFLSSLPSYQEASFISLGLPTSCFPREIPKDD